MSSETPSERRARKRAMRSGLTEEQLAHLEDEQFQRSRGVLRMFASLPAKMREGLVPLRRQTPTTGRPAGSGARITLEELESAVDRLHDFRPSQQKLADEIHVARSTLTTWLTDHPYAWEQLQLRWRNPRA